MKCMETFIVKGGAFYLALDALRNEPRLHKRAFRLQRIGNIVSRTYHMFMSLVEYLKLMFNSVGDVKKSFLFQFTI